ncbi:MAG: adenylate/guanylate cyclase domain-containing protein [Chthoniobacterales bacterium]
MTDHAAAQVEPSTAAPPRKSRSRLFAKYAGLFVAVVCVALVTNGLFEIWDSYREHKDALIKIQHEQAESAASKISQFVKEIESQLGWTTQLVWSPGTVEQRRFDALRLLRQVPAITELAEVDDSGKEQLLVSRLAMDVVGSGLDLSKQPKFAEAVKNKVYYGPVYFRRGSEPYMTLSLAGTRRAAGVSIAEVNLKLIWDVVSKIKVGKHGEAYVVDARGRLIAHPDISLVLRNTDMTRLAQVQSALRKQQGTAADDVETGTDIQGRKVLTAFAPVPPVGWTVFVELPVDEAYQPLFASIERAALILLVTLCLAALAGIFLARRMVVPIQALRAGAARIGSGDLSQRITIKTGDELEALADQFNDMAARLQESYADLEKKIEIRTHELREASEFLTSVSTKISKYISPQIYKSIFSGQRDVTIATERKRLTIFFSDIKDFTATTERLQPEDLTALLNEYFTEMSNIALRHGATVDKFMGDAMLLFFGDPETKGSAEDARACVEMAIEMQSRLSELNAGWRRRGIEEPFRARIGINTGYCNVGNFGSEDRMDYTIIGAEANLAARLQQIAEPGRIVMSYESYALVRDVVRAHPLAAITMKGISREVVPYAVDGLVENVKQRSQVLSEHATGVDIFLDLDVIDSESVERTRGLLQNALTTLERKRSAGA